MLFAVIAGAGTALSPCVLPILPALLSAGATGGRRRPLGIVLGLTVTFTITIVGIAKLVDGVGLGTGALRTVAVLVLLGFGALLLAPRLADRLEALAVAADPLRPAHARRRVRQRPRRRRRARLRLRAVRRPDPGRGDLGQRGLGVDGGGGAQLRGRLRRRPARALPRRPPRAAAASAGPRSSA